MDSIISLAKQLNDIQNKRLKLIKAKIKAILSSNNYDSNTLEHLLDELLDLYNFFGTNKIEEIYNNLCELLQDINPEAANDYISFLKEEKEDGEKILKI